MARIVVADDDADIRELVSYKLERAGHVVTAVGDGTSSSSPQTGPASASCRRHPGSGSVSWLTGVSCSAR
jgi:CheY-like chemotaxis protein